MEPIDMLFRFVERLYEQSPWLFWNVLAVLCGLMLLLWVCGVVAEAIARLKRQHFKESKANHRLFIWMRVGGFIVLYVALFPVMLVIAVVFFLWEDFKAARQILLESSETIRQAPSTRY
jgi:RsiW-degrading membrane proteinase PrsW (M82 family)